MTLTSASNEKYEWSLCGDVAKDLVGWQCRTSSSRPDDNGAVDVSKTRQVWEGSDASLCAERPTCEDVGDICSGFSNTTASECTGTATPLPNGTKNTPCGTDPTKPGCTGCTWTDGSKGAPGTCSGTANTLCSVAFSKAASDDKQSSCATGSPGTTWDGLAIPGCKYTRKDWAKGKCATADGTPFKSSILKQRQIDYWQSRHFSADNMTYVGLCPDDSDAIGTGTGPDRWPEGSQPQSTLLIYGGRGGFSLTIEDYIDGTGLDIKGAASTACGPKQTDCTVLSTQDLTSGGNVKVRDAPKDTVSVLKNKKVPVYPCPDKQACGTGAGGGLPVLFVFAMLGTTPRHRIPMLALSR